MAGNVSATSTTGLYGISSNVSVPNSAQQLLNLLYSNGNVDFSLTGGGTQVQANALVSGGGAVSGSVVLTGDVTASGNTGTPIATALSATGVVAGTYGSDTTIPTIVVDAKGRVTQITTNAVSGGGSYGNANVAAYLPTYTGSLANSSTIVAIDANLGTATTNITALQANAGSQQTQIDSLQSNAAGQATAINTINANVGAFETYANLTFSTQSNAASQQTQIDTNTTGLATLNANVGAFETYANLTFGTSNYGNANVAAYLPTYTGSLANSSTIQTIDANLGTATNNITTLFANAATQSTAIAGITNGTTTLANVKSTGGYFWANGTAYSTGSGAYGNTQVAEFLPTYTGDLGGVLRSGNVNSTGTVLLQSATGQGVFVASGAGANVTITADSYLDVTGNLGIVINNTPRVNILDGNLNVYKNTGTNANGSIYADNNLQAGTKVIAPAYTFANGVNILDTITGTYSNTNVAAYLDGSTTTVRNSAGSLSLSGNTAYLTLSPTAVGGIAGPVVYAANSSNIAAQGGIYSTSGYFWANGTVYSTSSGSGFTGNLAGSVLYDSINQRTFANAFPLSTPDSSISNNVYSSYMVVNPTYTNGQVQQPPLANATTGGTSIVSVSSQVVGLVQSANIALQSGYGYGSQNRNTVGALVDLTVTPVTANNMSNNDRVRAFTAAVDYQTRGLNVGAMSTNSQNASTITATAGLVYLNGGGSVGSTVGALTGVLITPPAALTSNVQYATGTSAFVNLLSTAGTSGKANVVYARGLAPFVTGFSSNLTVQNAIGMHTYSGWAGTSIGTGSSTGAFAAYAVLNEDAATRIQTNGNLTVTGNTQIRALQETVYATGFTGGAWTANVAQGTIQTATLTSSISSLAFTNMPAGGTVTLIITQGGSGSYTLTTTGIKYAGASSTLSTAVGAIDMLNVLFDGTNYYGSLVKGYA